MRLSPAFLVARAACTRYLMGKTSPMGNRGKMRWLLNCIYTDFSLAFLPYWLWKIPQGRRYRAGLIQRVGFSPPLSKSRRRLWVHTASVGEATIPLNLVGRFEDAYPGWEVVFSTFTDTGMDQVRRTYPDHEVFFWPLDFSFSVDLSLERVKPDAVVLVELEVWPNFLDACHRRSIPVAIINGRMSKNSRRLLRFASHLQRHLWSPIKTCCARSAEDAVRFIQAGMPAHRVFDCGSLKYDALFTDDINHRTARLRRLFKISSDARVLVAGSIHPGEENIICRVYKRLRREYGDLRLIAVPRHIERCDEMAKHLRLFGLEVVRKTDLDRGRVKVRGHEAFLVDTIGDLPGCYGLATYAFVGRSLIKPGGGQNMMEPAALGKAVLVGPYTGNFRPEMARLRQYDAVVEVQDENALLEQLERLLRGPERVAELGRNAVRALHGSQGATNMCLEKLAGMLKEADLI